MKFRNHKSKITNLPQLFDDYFFKDQYVWDDELLFLIDLVHLFRPKKPNSKNPISIKSVLLFLEENPRNKVLLQEYLKALLQNRKFSRMLSDAGILKDSDFMFEVKNRIFSKLLPYQPEKNTLEYVLNQVFYLSSDILWIKNIPAEETNQLFQLLGFSDLYHSAEENTALSEVLNAISSVSQRMSGRAMEMDVVKMLPEYDNLESPFMAFEKEFLLIENQIKTNQKHFVASEDQHYKQLLVLHKQCEEYVDKAFANSSKYGISLKVNQSLLRIRQQLVRLKIILALLVVDKESDKTNNTLFLGLKLIEYNCYKNNIQQLISDSTQLISYEITQHTAKTGEHYITESPREYFLMFITAIGGGFIVGILCVVKLLLSTIETSGFGHAFLYSLNYSLGFIAIYILGFTLATKQPAMTAATIIQSLESDSKNDNLKQRKYFSFAQLFARLFRSQFIAFVGNVLMAFPISLLGIWLLDHFFHFNISAQKTTKLLTDLSPILSPAIFHAAIAGFFLFLSGIISGNIANRNRHERVYYRIQEHPFLKKNLGKESTTKIANWFERYWAGIVSNGWFGVFLGSTAAIGIFLGLNLDIRHITFSSGNLALGLYGKNFSIDSVTLFWSIFGIGIIGFVNFMVSFSLSLGLAFRSRNIPLSEVKFLNKAVFSYFKERPFAFFFPLKKNN